MSVLLARVPTAAGDAALRFAIDEATRRGEELVVFHLKPKKTQSEVVEGVTVRHVVPDSMVLDPTEKLIDLVNIEEEDISVLVIGIKYRTPAGKLLLGSQSQRIFWSRPYRSSR